MSDLSSHHAEQLQAELKTLSNDELLRLVERRMESASAQRFSELLDRQQLGSLTEAEQQELDEHMFAYQDGMLHQAYALREAVQRGLCEPLVAG